jgi:hypothetical protein
VRGVREVRGGVRGEVGGVGREEWERDERGGEEERGEEERGGGDRRREEDEGG